MKLASFTDRITSTPAVLRYSFQTSRCPVLAELSQRVMRHGRHGREGRVWSLEWPITAVEERRRQGDLKRRVESRLLHVHVVWAQGCESVARSAQLTPPILAHFERRLIKTLKK